jgi:hypothetical protein
MENAINLSWVILLSLLFFLLGYSIYSFMNPCPTCQTCPTLEKKYDGLRIPGNLTHAKALDKAYEYDGAGDWVCANVRNMSYERMVEVCKHEAAHELFAEVCEKDDALCRQVQELLNNQTRGK